MSQVGAELTDEDRRTIRLLHWEREKMLERARKLELQAKEIRLEALPLTAKNLAAKFEVSPRKISNILWG